jgi:GTP-binding protein
MIDKIEIMVKSGDGGCGAVSFRREKFVPFGGPDGGDGGDGGDVVIVADTELSSLRAFRRKRIYLAADGKNGRGKRKHGKKGAALMLAVPVGTVVSFKTQMGGTAVIADLAQPGQQVVVVRGGRGGLSNVHFTSSTNQAPRIAQGGEAGEEKAIILEMRVIADVGIIGYPNVGKSTLLAAASAAKPEIAGYPFTTREPILGVVEVGSQSLVLAEIPGLIDGAHLGRGLGHDFLRHVGRTRILIHLVDGTSASPVENMMRVNAELNLFDSALAQKTQLVVINKVDLPPVRARRAEIKEAFTRAGSTVYFISAETSEGVSELMSEVMRMLAQGGRDSQEGVGKMPVKVFHPRPIGTGVRVRKEGDTFVVLEPELERIIAGTDIGELAVLGQIQRQLTRLGVSRALERAGVKPGDRIRCGDFEWEW